MIDVALRQQLLTQRVKLARVAAIQALKTQVSVVCRQTLAGRPDDAFSRMRKTEFLSLCSKLNTDLTHAFVDYNEELMEWIGRYIEFDIMVGCVLYAFERRQAVRLLDPAQIQSKFNAMILPGSGITPAQAMVQCTAFCVGRLVGRVRMAMPNQEAPAVTEEALLGGDKLRDVGSILAPCINAVTAIDATLVQAAHVTTNAAIIATV